ncbi:MAG: hypothetical protein ACT4PV_01510 [Planctomycetaceae bacterium]
MTRRFLPVLVLALAVSAEAPTPRKMRLRLKSGDRLSVTIVVSSEIAMTTRQGDRTTSTLESVQRTERFVDRLLQTGEGTGLRIARTYLKLFTKVKGVDDERPTIVQSPLTGRTVEITEEQRRRKVVAEAGVPFDEFLARTAGIEIDWRDIFPEAAVAPGDRWTADATALARRLDAYFGSGAHSHMRVRYERDVEYQGFRCAKLYVDWDLEGMRDRSLSTKMILAGDVYFDLDNERFVEIDLAGTQVIRGAILAPAPARIVKGEGPVSLRISVRPSAVDAAAPAETD